MQKLENGSYVKLQNDELEKVDYIDELIQNAILCLTTNRGKFYPNKNFGSRLYEIKKTSSLLALAYARQAVKELDGVFVKNCTCNDDAFVFDIIVNDEKGTVRVAYANI